MSAEQVFERWRPHIQAMVTTSEGYPLLCQFQRDLARDKAERMFLEIEAANGTMTDEEINRLFDQAAWVMVTALQETAVSYGLSADQYEELKGIIGTSINERMDELCGRAVVTETRQ